MRLTDRSVDLARLTIEHDDGTTSALTAREAALLAFLAARPGQDVTRDELLDEVWEYKANFATRAVDVAMRRLRSKVEPDPANPVHLISVHGVGYRFVPPPGRLERHYRLDRPLDDTSSERPRPPARRTNLPADQTSFVGRDDDLSAVARQFRGSRLVTLLGPGGIGKTRLAREFGRVVLETASPAGGVWYCDLSEIRSLAGLLGTVAAALDVPPFGGGGGSDAVAEQLGHALAERGPVLVLLDNFEQLVALAPVTVEAWMRDAPKARFLVASRERLRVAGEAIYELGPLQDEDATTLFLDRARAAGADLDPADRSIRAIIERLDRLPLAIELAAPRARVLGPSQLLDRLSARFQLLKGGAGRMATLREAIDWSWGLLLPWERDALMQCAVFAGGFTLEAVEGIVDLDDTGAPWALDVVEALRDKSLLRIYEPPDLPGELRFGMYESVRAYALEHLDPDSADAVGDRHAAWFVAEGERLAEAAEGPGGLDAVRRLALEVDNLLSVWHRQRQRDPALAARAALALEIVFHTQGPFEQWGDMLDPVVDAAARASPDLHARALTARAAAAALRGQLERARADLERANEHVAPGTLDELRVRHATAALEVDRGRAPSAAALVEGALALARRLRSRRWEGVLLGQLGAIRLTLGDVAGAEDHLRRSLVLHLEVGNERHQATTWADLGRIQLDLGRLEDAERNLQQALAVDRRSNNQRRVAGSLLTLAAVRGAQWRLDEAEALARDALRGYRSVGHRRLAGVATRSLGAALFAGGRLEAALEELHAARDTFEAIADEADLAATTCLLAAVHAERGELPEAAAALAHARALGGTSEGPGLGFLRVASGFLALANAQAERRRGDSSGPMIATARGALTPALGEPSVHAVRFFSAILERSISRVDRNAPRGPW